MYYIINISNRSSHQLQSFLSIVPCNRLVFKYELRVFNVTVDGLPNEKYAAIMISVSRKDVFATAG